MAWHRLYTTQIPSDMVGYLLIELVNRGCLAQLMALQGLPRESVGRVMIISSDSRAFVAHSINMLDH